MSITKIGHEFPMPGRGKSQTVRGTPGYPYYLALRWLCLLAGLGTCVAVLGHSWHTLP